ncbi:hypothetical protein D4764_06G0000370 [Takifugu flavidus]|uniref:Uncharacterized protein n=1 Tax=Takifugu flavidus TaxID=433684 RepID=A0A5C6MYH2_9TELE|nr:hypothetical protein D4764_06G0000370 [Takifugu flavidus]
MKRMHIWAKASLRPWMGCQSSAGPHVSLCGFGTLLKACLSYHERFDLLPLYLLTEV